MQIRDVSIFYYEIPLTEKINISDLGIESRKGYLLVLEDEKGSAGYGEISPLPGFDAISMEPCLEELIDFKKTAAGRKLDTAEIDFHADFFALLKTDRRYNPHVMTGIESALLMLLLNAGNKETLKKFNFSGNDLRVKLNGLYYPAPDESHKRQLLYLQKSGFDTVKIKIGRMPREFEIKRIRELCGFFNNNITIRLDCNRLLKYDDYIYYCDSLKDADIEYVEELRAADRTELPEKKEWALALDESLKNFIDPYNPSVKDIPDYINAVVLKPAHIAGLNNIIRFIAEAYEADIKIILSSPFNTGITIAALCLITGIIKNCGETAHGFDTYRYIKTDIIKDTLQIIDGIMIIPGSFFTEGPRINHKMLTEARL